MGDPPEPLERVVATRYVVPLKEGGSLPGVVEASDEGTYVLKFRGAGQGVKVLVAEIVVGELARALEIPVPRLALVDLDEQIARYEADEEVQDLLSASIGLNLGIDLLPGAFGYDGRRPPPPDVATRILWLDAMTANVDRTWSNPNLVVWHRQVWAIDHGAALYVHHSWPSRPPDPQRFAALPFESSTHVLREVAGDVRAAHDSLAEVVAERLAPVLDLVPDEWLEPTGELPDPPAVRAAYTALVTARLTTPDGWLP